MTILDAIDSGAYDLQISIALLALCVSLAVKLMEGDRT